MTPPGTARSVLATRAFVLRLLVVVRVHTTACAKPVPLTLEEHAMCSNVTPPGTVRRVLTTSAFVLRLLVVCVQSKARVTNVRTMDGYYGIA